jgi:hypothetical protein
LRYAKYISSFLGKLAMLKRLKSESESRKGVRLGPKGGSLGYESEGVRYVLKYIKMRITSQRNSVEETNKHLTSAEAKGTKQARSLERRLPSPPFMFWISKRRAARLGEMGPAVVQIAGEAVSRIAFEGSYVAKDDAEKAFQPSEAADG